ncbi:MAG: PEP-CTERM sorting domain-containing protein [Phycisphaerales bacterium]|nr:PEP-CTERM sorting domain-containing protein [Phycisphaerales bacterium]
MRTIVSGLALLVAAPAMAVTLAPGPIQSIPNTYNTSLQRPAVDNYRIIASSAGMGSYLGGVQSQLFTLASNSLTPIGSGTLLDNPQTNWAVGPLGYAQNNHVGIAGQWVAAGGSASSNSNGNSQTNLLWFLNSGGSLRQGGQSTNEHFSDIDANGNALWVRWNDAVGGTGFALMYQDLANNPGGSPTVLVSSDPLSPVYNAHFNDSACPNFADDGSGKIAWSSTTAGKTHYVYDLNTMTNYAVYNNPAAGNLLRNRMSDDGNWIVWNERSAATQGTSNRSDIMLLNVSNPALPGVAINLTNDQARLREDPNIEIYGDNTAIIVWGERDSAQIAGNYEIKGMVVSNLSGTPTAGPIITLATEVGRDLRYPDIDQNMIAWARNPNAVSVETYTQYMLIPEPASLALLALGGMALIRRR